MLRVNSFTRDEQILYIPIIFNQSELYIRVASYAFIFLKLHMSNVLGQTGFNVYKSIPYGPLNEVLAYLGRRATENRDVMKRTEKERSLLWLELKRRMRPSLLA